jgi:phage baseplate assembly protein gpV
MNMQGVVIGTVCELDEPLGRIRADLPWLGKKVRSAWAPVASLMSGGKRGVFFMPEVGDEVLIAFEHGRFHKPFVLGFLWNGVDRAPESDRQSRVILTPGGHTVRFEDKDNAKKIIIRTAGKRSITLDDTPKKEQIEIKCGGHTILMDEAPGSAAVTIETAGKQKLELHDVPASVKVSMSGGASLEFNAQGVTLTVPKGTVTVNASAAPVTVNCASATLNTPMTTFNGAVTVNGMLTVSGLSTMNGGVTVTGLTTLNGLATISGMTTMSAGAVVTGIVSVSGMVQVNGAVQSTAIISPLYTPGVGNLL